MYPNDIGVRAPLAGETWSCEQRGEDNIYDFKIKTWLVHCEGGYFDNYYTKGK